MNASVSVARPAPRRHWLGLLGLLLVLGFAFQGARALYSTDEGRYSSNALQMVDSGHFLMPHYSVDRPNFTKPPMTAWVIAGSIEAFGRSAWAVRTPYALAFILTALLVAAMGRDLVPDKPWLPGLIYASSLFPFLAANIVSTDVILTLFEALAVLGFVRAWLGRVPSDSPAALRWRWLMWLGFGLAFLTKGPPGLMPLLGMAPFVFRREGWRGLGRLFGLTGLALFLVVGFSWYALVVIRTPGLLDYYLHYEVYDRLFTGAQGRHAQWYGWITVYLPVLLLGSLPWWPAVARRAGMVLTPARWVEGWRRGEPSLFLWLWFVVPMVVFCLSRSRLPLYVLPLFMPQSLLLARALAPRIDLARRGQQLALGAWLVLLLAIKATAAYAVHPKADNRLRTQQVEAMAHGARFDAMAFILDTTSRNAVEESTPWGMRMYMNRPVYGIGWHQADRETRLCKVLHRHPDVLLAVDAGVRLAEVKQAAARCRTLAAPAPSMLGTWRHRRLVLMRTSPAPGSNGAH
jgi:4-amino-4-deoxy-L-arabinose transferase-like glycosyltransferase